MTVRDLFRVLIKLFCVYSLVQVALYYIPINAFSLFYSFDLTGTVISLILLLAVTFGIFYVLLGKVDTIVDVLKLDQGFDNSQIQIGNFEESKIFSIAVILIGGFLIVDYLPSFLNNFYISFINEVRTSRLDDLFTGNNSVDYFDWGISVMNLILGYLIIVNHSCFSNKLVSFSKK